jgi:hypothetical protein
MSSYNWTSFELKIPIKTSKEAILKAWLTPAGIESWFLRSAKFYRSTSGYEVAPHETIEPEDKYEWLWHGYDDRVKEKGTILRTNHKDHLAFTFSGQTRVTIFINQEEDLCMCRLFQDEIPDNEKGRISYHIGSMSGWIFYLTNLKSILEGGIDLRNKDLHIHHVINS